jgi:hypothetical protein
MAPAWLLVGATFLRRYLVSAGPRQLCVWGSRVRPLPQPPTISRAERLAIDTLGQAPCSRKVPFAFAPSTTAADSSTQPQPNRSPLGWGFYFSAR